MAVFIHILKFASSKLLIKHKIIIIHNSLVMSKLITVIKINILLQSTENS